MKRTFVIAILIAFVVWLAGCATIGEIPDNVNCQLNGGKFSCEFVADFCATFPDSEGCKENE